MIHTKRRKNNTTCKLNYFWGGTREFHYNCCSTSNPLRSSRQNNHFPIQAAHDAPSPAAAIRTEREAQYFIAPTGISLSEGGGGLGAQ